MISNTIRAYNIQSGRYPSVFIYKNTPAGIFNISDVEAEVTEKLTPLEELGLKLAENMDAITRIELHAVSGISIDLCDRDLKQLQYHGLLRIVDYDSFLLKDNISRIINEIGDDWYTPYIQELEKRELLKQYALTEDGKNSIQSGMKTITDAKDLNLVITGDPFYVFYDNMDLRTDGYEYLDMSKDLVKNILAKAEEFSQYSGIKPLAIGSNSVLEGKEVSNTQFWITIQPNGEMDLESAKYGMYLTSTTFDRWSNPSWNQKLEDFVPDIERIDQLVIKAMSETYVMVEDVIEEGLELMEDRVTWRLEADLEMQMLIHRVMPEPLSEVQAEVKLKYPNSHWKVVILLQLEPYDDLSKKSLFAGRLHANVPRKGFTLEEGYTIWKDIMNEWDKPVKRQQYIDAIDTLVEFDCLIERTPDTTSIVVDVDDVLSANRRGRQKWQFNRLREIEHLLEQSDIQEVYYLATDKIYSKIDEIDSLNKWLDDEKIEIVEGYVPGTPTTIERARDLKAHYLGTKTMGSDERVYSRTLEFIAEKKKFQIPGLEAFYDWRMENLYERMFDVYYE